MIIKCKRLDCLNDENGQIEIYIYFIFFLLMIGVVIAFLVVGNIQMDAIKNSIDNYEDSINITYTHYIQETNGKNLTNTEKYQTIVMVCDLYSTLPNWCKGDVSKKVGIIS